MIPDIDVNKSESQNLLLFTRNADLSFKQSINEVLIALEELDSTISKHNDDDSVESSGIELIVVDFEWAGKNDENFYAPEILVDWWYRSLFANDGKLFDREVASLGYEMYRP